MQRGTVRPRSPSAEGDDLSSTSAPATKRPRSAAAPSSHCPFSSNSFPQLTAETADGAPDRTTNLPSATGHSRMDSMGHPMPSSNGSGVGGVASSTGLAAPSDAGPSTAHSASAPITADTNGHTRQSRLSPAALAEVQRVPLSGKLMYEDDKDWVESQRSEATQGQNTEVSGEEEDGEETGVFKKRIGERPGVGGGKRMPVDREEVVRLILQGLRDIGYQ